MELFNTIFLLSLMFTFKKTRERGGYVLNLETCNVLKGIAIIGVFVGHCSKVFTGVFLYKLFCSLGLFSVSLFFFISGYGLMCSIIKKGKDYRRFFLQKRIFPLLITYLLSILLCYMITDNSHLTSRDIVLCGYVPFSWYILSIIALYLMTYVSLFISEKGVVVITIVSLLLCTFIISASLIDNLPYPLLGGGQMITFVIGMIVSFSNKLKTIQGGYLYINILLFSLFWCIQLTDKYVHYHPVLYDTGQYIMSYTFPFVAFGLLNFFCLRERMKSIWLRIQKYTLEIYLIHGCILYYALENKIWGINSEVAIFVILSITFLLAFIFKNIQKVIIHHIGK